jgi:hypothetical protein
MWQLAREEGDSERIRLFREREDDDQTWFAITYHHSKYILEGTDVIRRFVGPEPSGWRNDTVDAKTGEFLQTQGAQRPLLTHREAEILADWNIAQR